MADQHPDPGGHRRAADVHRRAAKVHESSSNLHEAHAAEMAEKGEWASVERAERLADRERELAEREASLADRNLIDAEAE